MSKKKLKKNIPSYQDLLSKLPNSSRSDTYHFADYIELKCLSDPDRTFTLSQFVDILKKGSDFKDGSDQEPIEDVFEGPQIIVEDPRERFAKDVFQHLDSRQSQFKNYYPFIFDDASSTIRLREKLTEKLTTENRIYLLLLFSSCLQYTKRYQADLTSIFEVLCMSLIKKMLPQNCQPFFFGSSNRFIKKGDFLKLSFEDKCNLLSKRLAETNKIVKGTYSEHNYGDGKLDIVAWLSSGDDINHNITYLAQCACGTSDWQDKQSEATYDTWDSRIDLSSYPVSIMFIPFSFRSVTGNWFNKNEIKKVVLIDRKRCLHHFDKFKPAERKSLFNRLAAKKIINSILKEKKAV